jgi:hypothetical protein
VVYQHEVFPPFPFNSSLTRRARRDSEGLKPSTRPASVPARAAVSKQILKIQVPAATSVQSFSSTAASLAEAEGQKVAFDELQREYGLSVDDIRAALLFARCLVDEEQRHHPLQAPRQAQDTPFQAQARRDDRKSTAAASADPGQAGWRRL